MATHRGVICASSALADGCDGVRFEASLNGVSVPAFVVRVRGVVHGYVNRCAHVPVELDWQPGKFFGLDRQTLICSVHGAHYSAVDGRCVLGPCRGASLQRVAVAERAGWVVRLESPPA